MEAMIRLTLQFFHHICLRSCRLRVEKFRAVCESWSAKKIFFLNIQPLFFFQSSKIEN